MGLGLSWVVLSLLNLYSASGNAQDCLQDHSFVICGDDLCASWPEERREQYKRRMESVGGELNLKKSYIGRRGVFCEKTSKLETTKNGKPIWVFKEQPLIRVLTLQRASHASLRHDTTGPAPTTGIETWGLARKVQSLVPSQLKALMGLYARKKCPYREEELDLFNNRKRLSPEQLVRLMGTSKPSARPKNHELLKSEFDRVNNTRSQASMIAGEPKRAPKSKEPVKGRVPLAEVELELNMRLRIRAQRYQRLKVEMTDIGERRVREWSRFVLRGQAKKGSKPVFPSKQEILAKLNKMLLDHKGPIRAITRVPRAKSPLWRRIFRMVYNKSQIRYISTEDAARILELYPSPPTYDRISRTQVRSHVERRNEIGDDLCSEKISIS